MRPDHRIEHLAQFHRELFHHVLEQVALLLEQLARVAQLQVGVDARAQQIGQHRLGTTSAPPSSRARFVGFRCRKMTGISAVSGLDLSCWQTL
jgi:hypothetical protein